MILRPEYAFGASLAVALLALTVSGSRLSGASTRLDATLDRNERLTRDAREVLALRTQQARVELREPPKQDVIAQVNSVLGAAGLPVSRFKDLERDADVALGDRAGSTGSRYRRQSLRLVLEGMSVLELGAFLREWQRLEPAWTVGLLDLVHATTPGPNADRLIVRMQITATYLAEAGTAAPR